MEPVVGVLKDLIEEAIKKLRLKRFVLQRGTLKVLFFLRVTWHSFFGGSK